ncbi:branched-chain-amino-acid aminotransferase, cytosolic-like [Pomacea canaliculata]|uniref:branched-chain-amino-acid aminotransferase, cytosolic-like n=1 Tax=Pomacea canaliculata TaxID=400727 RepID=UPI000D72584C|nr:branched-chain-amino-acid aminotransferase, cytosolic-like [Pomacea canaliculata]
MAILHRTGMELASLMHKAFDCGRQSLATISTFNFKDLEVTLTETPQPKPKDDELIFGHNFTDHMLSIEWSEQRGWDKPCIHPVRELLIHPAAKVLHIAIELFEGMKGYRCVDGKIRLFRAMENMKRMRRTAERASLPPSLIMSKSSAAKLFVLLSPVGPYFHTGFKPVTLLADPRFVRAWPGSCGSFKMGANYAPTIQVQDHAMREMDCQQVLWLFGDDHKLTEVGTMNLFMYWINEQGEEELVTPPLHGLILPGITRKSLLELSQQWGGPRKTHRLRGSGIKIDPGLRGEGNVWAGTACVVCPIEKILYQGQILEIPTMTKAKLTNRFFNHLTDIQYGRIPHSWMEGVDDDTEVVA